MPLLSTLLHLDRGVLRAPTTSATRMTPVGEALRLHHCSRPVLLTAPIGGRTGHHVHRVALMEAEVVAPEGEVTTQAVR